MSATTAVSVPRASALDRDTAMTLAATEYERLADVLRSLEPADWARSTDCPGWDVRAVAGHCLGMARMAGGFRETVRQQGAAARAARRTGRLLIDELTALQVREQAHLSPDGVVEAFRWVGAAAVTGRRRTPRPLRALSMSAEVDGAHEKWRVGFLVDVVLTRDPWMHRIDICRATGRDMVLTPEHDGRVVADVVAEWASRHRRPYDLVLTGPAGGHWSSGRGGEQLQRDAIEFCRILSGRATGQGLLGTAVPF